MHAFLDEPHSLEHAAHGGVFRRRAPLDPPRLLSVEQVPDEHDHVYSAVSLAPVVLVEQLDADAEHSSRQLSPVGLDLADEDTIRLDTQD